MKINKKNEFLLALGKRIKSVRVSKGLSLADLSHTCNMEKASLSKIENGKINISFITLYRISRCLEVSIEDLIAE